MCTLTPLLVPAGTRARGAPGDVQQDFYLGLDLLRGEKEHSEFCIVRDWVRERLTNVCNDVNVDVSKALLKQAAVQHLYAKLSGQLEHLKNDAALLVRRPPLVACHWRLS